MKRSRVVNVKRVHWDNLSLKIQEEGYDTSPCGLGLEVTTKKKNLLFDYITLSPHNGRIFIEMKFDVWRRQSFFIILSYYLLFFILFPFMMNFFLGIEFPITLSSIYYISIVCIIVFLLHRVFYIPFLCFVIMNRIERWVRNEELTST